MHGLGVPPLAGVARLPQLTPAFPVIQAGRLLHCPFRGLLNVHSRSGQRTRQVAHGDPLHRSPFIGMIPYCLIATGWSDQLPGGNLTH